MSHSLLPPLPPEVSAYFEEQRNHQKKLEKTSLIQAELRDTTTLVHGMFERLRDRGVTMNDATEQTQDLLESSEEFYRETRPNWKRYLYSWIPPAWWFEEICCCRIFRKKSMR